MTWYVLRTNSGDYLGWIPVPSCGNGAQRGLPVPCSLMNALVFPTREEAERKSERVLNATGLSSAPVRLRMKLEDRGREALVTVHAEGSP